MKFKNVITYAAFALASLIGVASCGGSSGGTSKKFTFTVGLESGRNSFYMNESETFAIKEENRKKDVDYSLKVEVLDSDGNPVEDDPSTTTIVEDDPSTYLTIGEAVREDDKVTYSITPKITTDYQFGFSVKAIYDGKPINRSTKFRKINEQLVYQNDASNLSGNADARTDILGKLEEYAMESALTGITLFEQGGYVRYSNRVTLGSETYIPGYGFGLLTEGSLNGTLPGTVSHPSYLQSSTSSDPLTINAWDATGSQVSELNGYISSSYWGTKIDHDKPSAYKWYPVLARNTFSDGENIHENIRPIPLDLSGNPIYENYESDTTSTYKSWRIYVKTGDEHTPENERIYFRTGSSVAKVKEYDNTPVTLKDYLFAFQLLLSQESDLIRGAELANDTSYGIKGAQTFYVRSKGLTDDTKLDKLFNDMIESGDLGLKGGYDTNGAYIDVSLLSPVNKFYAMYNLSSSLYSPMSEKFLNLISKNGQYVTGAKKYGTFKDDAGANINTVINNVLCVGPYYLESWSKGQQTVFARNGKPDDPANMRWFEVTNDRYKIPGVVITVYTAATQKDDAIYENFQKGLLDSTNIPQSRMSEKLGTDKQTQGDSTFKLNVNSCTQDRWNELFGNNGKILHLGDNAYRVKPWMSNRNFLKGLHWSIKRVEFAEKRGVTPSVNYFANSYMSDGENGVSYNSTSEHEDAIANFTNENYGYSEARAVGYFRTAVQELLNQGLIERGTKNNPKVINIHIRWMYQSDINDYGQEIAGYFQTAFNNDAVSQGTIKLVVQQDAVAQWDQVYNDYLMQGKYDLAFGAISGNTLNPLNFLEVLRSDNSSGFTLNWGADTGIVDPVNPIRYNGKVWSFDALWEAGDHGSVVKKGVSANPIEHAYKTSEGVVNELYLSGDHTIQIPFSFVDVETDSLELNITDIRVYLFQVGSQTIPSDKIQYSYEGGKITNIAITFNGDDTTDIVVEEEGVERHLTWNESLVKVLELDKKAEKAKTEAEKFALLHPFTLENYDLYWNIEILYTLKIKGDTYSSENIYNVDTRAKENNDKTRSFQIARSR